MSSYLVQSGSSLYPVSRSGVVGSAVVLPASITLYGASQPCRIVLFGGSVDPIIVVANGGTHDFWIDSEGLARKLAISPPISAPSLSAGVLTGLTGAYSVAVTFKVKSNGITIAESGLGPISTASAALANQSLRLDQIPVSGDTSINARGLYRSLSGGNVLYPWFDIDNNTTLLADRGVSDALLSLLPTTATTYGAPPDLKLLVSWRDRLWGVARTRPDFLRWTEEKLFYAWNATNEAVIPPQQADEFGATAFIPRRDQLGVARLNKLHQMTGFSNDTFQRDEVSDTIGCVSQESVVVVRDVAYFLGPLGIVEWGQSGIGYISEAQVDPWFRTDTYFNRSLFSMCRGRYNPDTDSVEFLLASAGSSSLDRWIAYRINDRTWLGPHKTDAFSPTCIGGDSYYHGVMLDTNNLQRTIFGSSDGYLYIRDSTKADDTSSAAAAVDFIVDLPYLYGTGPDEEQVWGQPTIHTRAESSGTLQLIPAIGDIGVAASPSLTHNLTLERERLDRLGKGRYCQIRLKHQNVGELVQVRGIEVPFTRIGRR